jgi:hypothetical protein
MKSIFRILSFVLSLVLITSCSNDDGPWRPLFNDNDLEGFEQFGGDMQYEISNGTLTGTSIAETPSSYLSTNETFADFILEFKVKLDTSLNSGVQIRSNRYHTGGVHGYQVEIENDKPKRLWSGGIYEQSRRGWLNNLTENDEGRFAFRPDDWNHYRVEAIGNSIKTWVNGVMCANLVDDFDSEGFISFQVHSVNKKKKPWAVGTHVQWKDVRVMTEELETYRFKGEDPVPVTYTLLNNQLTEQEKADGWELLFDGKSMEKWRGAHKEDFPGSGWMIEDGLLHLSVTGGGESEKVGDIVTREEFSDFELTVDFRLSPGANSGIKYYVTEGYETTGSAIGLEFQLLDDELHEDANNGRDGNRTLSSLYDLIPATKNKMYRSPGDWNIARIVSDAGRVVHYLNGKKVLEYQRGSKEYLDIVAISKYKDWENFGEAESGHILLQEHGNEVWFRNIKIRRLNE